jgi:hypothetical protein
MSRHDVEQTGDCLGHDSRILIQEKYVVGSGFKCARYADVVSPAEADIRFQG